MKRIVSWKRLADIALLGILFLGVRAYDAVCFVISNTYSFFEALFFMWLITVGISCIVVYLHDFCFEKYGWDLLDLRAINALRAEDIGLYHPWRRLAKWAVARGKVWIFLIFSWLTGPFVVALLLRSKRAWGHTLFLVLPASLLSALVWVSVWAGVGLLVWEDYFQPFFFRRDYVDTKKSGLHGMSILRSEADDFLSKGRDSFALPQTNAQGDFSQGKFLNIDGVKALDLTRLDYLSLGSRSEVRDIMIDCIRQYDISCPASQMVMRSGSTDRLERALADFHGMESSFVFLSGYAANEDLMQALGMRLRIGHLQGYVRATGMGSATREIPTVFFVDSESHFSLQHGIRVAKGQSLKTQCRSHSFESGDYEALEGLLDRSMEQMGEQVFRVIVTDALSSISGKVFDIARLCRIAERFDCMLYVDEAHSVGSMGPGGRGITSSMPEFQYYRDRIFLMGTLTKTISQLGGYVTMSGVDNALLRACCPHYIFSAPVPPWMAEATIRVLNLIGGDYGEEARNNLSTRSKHMRERLVSLGFDTLGSNSHIIPIFIGDEARAKSIKLEMLKSGFLASLFIYPAVQKSNALVRFSLTSDVEMDEIDAIVDCFVAAAKRY